jgi:serine/threonine protein phosphatase 1
MNSSKIILLGQNLWETALSLDRSIKPNDMLYPKRLTLYDEIYIGHPSDPHR